ncbi:517_t:CDS:1, partial [Funneliformis caledonium]
TEMEKGSGTSPTLQTGKYYSFRIYKWRDRDLHALYHSSFYAEPQRQCWGTGDLYACLMLKSLRLLILLATDDLYACLMAK